MGRVIKGSPQSLERYIVLIPATIAAQPERDESAAVPAADSDAVDADLRSSAPAQSEPPVAAAPDIKAIEAQAQKLIDDGARSAQTLIDDARERARALIDEAAREALSKAEDVRRQAHDDGYLAGEQTAQNETAAMLSTLRELVEATRTARHALISAAEPELVRLAVTIAERVLHQQIALDPGVVVEMAKAAIARIVDRENITVRVNPADIEAMREHRDALLALGDVKTMRVIEDQRVDRGGVIIDTDGGTIDAKISSQVAEARKIVHIVDDVVVQPKPIKAGRESALIAAQAS